MIVQNTVNGLLHLMLYLNEKHTTIINRLTEGMTDVYDKDFIDIVIRKLNKTYE